MNKVISLLILSFLCVFLISCEPWNLERKTFPICNQPNAKITLSITNLTVNFALSNLEGPITKILWNFGDGNSSDQISNFSYTYKNTGTYTIKVSVFNACDDRKDYSFSVTVYSLPAVSTLEAVALENTDILAGISVTSNGNTLITKYGICISSSSTLPTIENDLVNSSISNPKLNTAYTFRFSNLLPNNTYYYRAFATNASGIAYGAVQKINTMPANTSKGNTLIFPLNLKGRDNPICFTINKKLYTGMGADDNGKFYNDLWEYDTQKNTWQEKASLPSTARVSAISFAINGKGYVGLGSGGTSMLNDFWEYNPTNDTWTRKTDFPSAARWAAFSISHNGLGYVGGGSNNLEHFNDFWEFNPSTNSWTRKINMPLYKLNSSGFSIGKYLYMGFGQNMPSQYANSGKNSFDFWQYDASTNRWLRKADIPSDIHYDTKINLTINGKGYVGRFDKDFPTILKMYFYTPEIDNWDVNNGFLAIPRYFGCSGVIDNIGYYGFGGSSGNLLNDFWLFKP